jgi:hypothetical protein
MSDLLSVKAYDLQIYRYRCKKYNEEIQYTVDNWGNLITDCYGEHARKLEMKDRYGDNFINGE